MPCGQSPSLALTDVLHGEASAGFEHWLAGFHGARREGHVPAHERRLHGRGHYVRSGHRRPGLVHLDAALHVGGLAGRRPALHGPGHGRGAGHLQGSDQEKQLDSQSSNI